MENGLLEIDSSDRNKLEKCTQKIKVCQSAIEQLRELFLKAELALEEEQIHFFKKVKPQFISELHVNMETFKYYREKPKSSFREKNQHINFNLEKVGRFLNRHCELSTYVKLEADHLDTLYFTKRPFDPKLHGNLVYPQDILFSSPADPTLSCLLAAERFIEFLKKEKLSLKNPQLDPSWENLKHLTWNKSKTDLVELIYSLHASKSITCDLKESVTQFEKLFNIDIGNIYRFYTDIKYKKNPTSFINELETSLLTKIQSEN
jgi:hypothetical protein